MVSLKSEGSNIFDYTTKKKN